ncbi:hypothetical protein KAU34_10595, partial [candidate division WOR-3 bacterium]|nr:hypothetical protein [candidate division WOR-3 bacterium]
LYLILSLLAVMHFYHNFTYLSNANSCKISFCEAGSLTCFLTVESISFLCSQYQQTRLPASYYSFGVSEMQFPKPNLFFLWSAKTVFLRKVLSLLGPCNRDF